MTLSIFCPSSHLVLSAARCPQCGWSRPESGAIGTSAWEPLELGAELGGPGRHVFYRPAAAQGLAVFPVQGGELAGIALADGKLAWRAHLDAGLMTRSLVLDGNHLLASISDERQFTEAEQGQLVSLDPASGKITLLWQADTPLLSLPVLTRDFILLRTSKPELLALRRGAGHELLWRAALNSSGALLPPCICGKHVFISDGHAMQGKTFIAAYELESGRLAGQQPTEGILSQPMAATAEVIIFQDGRKRLAGLEAASLKLLWKKDYERLYTPPSVHEDIVYVVVRGGAGKGESGYYSLHLLQSRSGELIREIPLAARIIIPPLVAEGKVFLGSEDGQLFCLDGQNGDLLLQVSMGSDEDPLRTELLLAEGLLVAGTYSGKVGAVRVATVPEEAESPETYEKRGDFENAAAAWALQGNYRKAARLYADKLENPCKAFALYEHAGLFQEAGTLARSLDSLEEAQRYFQMAGNTKAEAEVALKRGDKLTAARLLEQAGELPQAAGLYEEVDEFSKAKDIYRQLGDWEALIRLNAAGPLSLSEIEVLEKMGKIPEAAEAAWKAGLLRKAVDLFQQAGIPGRELDALLELAKKEPEKWVFERIAELARKAGRFLEEAQSREQLGKSLPTAEAYQRAAGQAEQVRQCDEGVIAALYEKASHYFNDLDLLDLEQQCRDKVARYRHLPVVRIDGQTEKDFKELEWNRLELTISNQGYGLATDVHWRVSTDKFELTDDTSVWEMRRLGAGHQRTIRFDFRPKKGEIGAVPFSLVWTWKSEAGEEFHDKISTSVPVKTRDDTRPTGQPVIFQGGTLIQTEKYIAGDDVTGGQKGDSVKIESGRGVKLTAGQDTVATQPGRKSADQVCPTCHLPVEADAEVCIYCGNELPKAQTSRRKK